MGVKHTTAAVGTNDASKQVSVTVWNETHTVVDGVELPANVYPSLAPNPAGGVQLFNLLLMAEWQVIAHIDSSARYELLCSHPARTNFYKLVATGGNASNTFALPLNHAITATGNTFSAITPTSGSEINNSHKYRVAANTTNGTAVDIRPTTLLVCRDGGFAFSTTFKLTTTSTNNFSFFGLVTTTSALGATTNPTTNTGVGRIGIGIPNNSGNWDLVHNVQGTAPTLTDLGTDFPVNTTDWIRLSLFCTPTDTTVVYYQIENITNGLYASGAITTNIPTTTTMLTPHQYLSNNSNGVAVAFDSTGYYLQTVTI